MKKRGSLNLSIEAIVIIVIAFVVLGLGLGFVREQFKDIGGTTKTIQEQIRQQIIDDLRTGNKKLSFPATKLDLGTNEETVQAIGIKNTEDRKVEVLIGFNVKVGEEFKAFESQSELSFTVSDNTVRARIDWDNSPQSLKPGETRIIPVTITSPDKTGNYLYKIVLTDKETGEDFDSRTFFIKTS